MMLGLEGLTTEPPPLHHYKMKFFLSFQIFLDGKDTSFQGVLVK